MYDDNQIFVAPSFVALCSDAQGRLRQRPDEVRARYELCEDLANQLVAQAQTLYHVQAPSEAHILHSLHAGLCTPESGLAHAEATWVVCRLAELLVWECPALEGAD